MSTKATISHGETWHLYEEMMDDSINLELNEAQCAAMKIDGRFHSITLTLPQDVIQAIACYARLEGK